MPDNVAYLYLTEIDLIRVGNKDSPRLDHVREAKDTDVYLRNGISMVVSNGKGVCLFTEEELAKRSFSGWVWKMPRNTTMPTGLGIYSDHSGHFMICPRFDMPLDQYKGLLSQLAVTCQRMRKIGGK